MKLLEDAILISDLPEGDLRLKSCLGNNKIFDDRVGLRGYNRVYSLHMKQDDAPNLLEIGIRTGYGLRAWKDYFDESEIAGVDISFSWIQADVSDCTLYKASTTESEFWKDKPEYDYIIDDGDHDPVAQVNTMEYAMEHLVFGGLYFIEDVSDIYGPVALQYLCDYLEDYVCDVYKHHNPKLNASVTKYPAGYPNCVKYEWDYIIVVHGRK